MAGISEPKISAKIQISFEIPKSELKTFSPAIAKPLLSAGVMVSEKGENTIWSIHGRL